ncbi:FK506-binding protein 5-like protein [Carex littledalei]|uniref:FK506-binding protein 5-like protein n=1 Tax=Carex littledalei TaxID=544730 RepID=A0A833VI72_9POAL|nr:FK506-binding protein 5-like protein [Carex littledalei]
MTKEGKKKSLEEQGKEDLGKIEDQKSQEKEMLLPKVENVNETEATEEVKKDEGIPKEKNEKQKKNGGEVKEPGEKPEAPLAKSNPSVQLPPEEVVLKVFMHCEGCAKKVRKSLRGLEGVEDVKTDCKTNKVVVKGKKAAQDPSKVAETIYRKSGKRVEILSPAPAPLLPKNVAMVEMLEKKKEEKTNQKKPEKTVVVVLKVYMHCEACAEEIKRRILKLSGVQAVETTLVTSQVKVMGNFDPDVLVKYLYKRTGKQAFVVKQEQVIPAADKPAITADEKPANGSKPENAKENEKKEEKTEEKPKEENKDKEEGSSSTATLVAVVDPGDGAKGNGDQHNCYYFPKYPMEYAYPYSHPYQYPYSYPPPPQYQYPYMPPPPPPPPPQIFSDENPNACIVM